MHAATASTSGEPHPELESRFAALGRLSAVRQLGRRLSPYPSPRLTGSTLNRMEQSLVEAVADAFFPKHGPFPRSGSEADILAYFDGYMDRSRPQERFMLHLLLLFTELSPVAFSRRHRPFTRLSSPEREQFLRGAFDSRIYFRRVAFTSLRALMTMAYLAHPDIALHIGLRAHLDPFDLGAQEVSP